MKKIILLALVLFLTAHVSAQEKQDTTYWTRKGTGGLTMSQVSLSNWAAGGEGSVAGDVNFAYSADYKKGKHLWQNRLELAYGLNYTKSNNTRKTNDKIYLNSMYGYELAPKWYLSGFINFQTQFAKGYNYGVSDQDYISRFLSPGYLSVGPGITWIPNNWFNATFSPATWRGTFVKDNKLSDEGAFGVTPGKHLLSEFGASLRLEFNREIFKNMTLYSRLEFFSNYLDKPQNVDIYWTTQLAMKINEWFSALLSFDMIYDDNIKILQKDGTKGARLQVKEALGIGFQMHF